MKYPDDSVQNICTSGEWWQRREKLDLCRGRLVRAIVPHVDVVPLTVTGVARKEDTDHSTAHVRFDQLNIRQRTPQQQGLPIAALPDYGDGMGRLVCRAKIRPAIVVDHAHDWPDARPGQAKWQVHPTITLVPAYGVEQTNTRAGWPEDLLKNVRRAKWPQYMWDALPINTATRESVFMIARAFPVGRHQNYYELLPWVLSDEALDVVDSWMIWLRTGKLNTESVLYIARDELLKLDPW